MKLYLVQFIALSDVREDPVWAQKDVKTFVDVENAYDYVLENAIDIDIPSTRELLVENGCFVNGDILIMITCVEE